MRTTSVGAAVFLVACMSCRLRPPEPGDQAAGCAPGAAGTTAPTVIRLAGGRTVSLHNDITEGDAYVCHRDRGPVRPQGYHLVERVYYEGHDYLLINSTTGHRTALPDTPVISPGGERVLVSSMDYEAGLEPNFLQVWRVTRDSLVREWELKTGEYAPARGWGASDPTWLSDTSAEVTKNEPENVDASALRRSRVRLLRQPSGGWVLQPAE